MEFCIGDGKHTQYCRHFLLRFLLGVLQLVQQGNWIPDAMSQAVGTEIQKLSFMGPFLELSVFAEDDVSISHT